MLFKIAIICDEAPDFFREITIDSDANFLDLNNAILSACGYDDSQITSFCTCSDEWEEELQIVREDMGTTAADQDIYIMAETPLNELIEDEEQKLTFTFDPINNRVFFLEVTDIITGKHLDKAECTVSKGEAPNQQSDFDLDFSDIIKKDTDKLDCDLDDYNNEVGYNEDEYDPDGYSTTE